MVKGNESLVVCSLAWERSVPDIGELSAIKETADLLEHAGAKMYADVLDARLYDHTNESALFVATEPLMAVNGLWLVVVAGHRRQQLLTMQAAIARARNMQVVVAYQDTQQDTFPFINAVAVDNGHIFYWGNREEYFEGIQDVVLPICNNGTNDCDTIWTSERKTA